MTGHLYLSEAVNIKDIKPKQLNIIQSYCGSGKTHFALTELPKLASTRGKCLYIIDTINGREQILKNENTAPNNDTWEEYIKNGREEYEIGEWMYGGFDENNIVVMTYAAFGAYSKKIKNFGSDFELIICDELHSGVEMSTYDKKKYYNCALFALEWIKSMIVFSDIKVVALTATPTLAIKHYMNSIDIEHIKVNKDIRRYEEHEKIKYKHLDSLLNQQYLADKKGIIYEHSITEMRAIQNKLTQQGIKSIPVWSLKPQKSEDDMNAEQLLARECIIKNETFPFEYDALIINKALETGINIKSENGKVDYVIVNSFDTDVQTQARGRYRDDLDLLYVLSYNADTFIEIPKEFLNRKLFKDDKDKLCKILNMGWTTVRQKANESGYEIKEGQSVTRYSIFTEIKI